MKQHSFTTRLKSLTFIFGIALAFASCANDDIVQNGTTPTDDKGLTAFSTGTPTTRTSMKEDGTFYWEAGDKIYVKDDGGTWHASSNAPTVKTSSFKFMVPGTYTAHNSYEVYYPGKNGTNDQVTIPAAQTQTVPNTTTHFGVSGDCGMATASRIGTNNQFNFTLDHKVAFLRFLPRTSNKVLKNCYLTKVEVTSDNDIAATYTLDKLTGKLQGTGSGKQIILTTQGIWGGAYQNGFPLTNNVTSASTNGAYMIIKPGTHTLKIRYWVRDIVTSIEGTITKYLSSKAFDTNKYYDVTANLDVKDYDGNHYFMWDAIRQYWAGHEWYSGNKDQPIFNGDSNSNVAKNNSDLRWYHEGGGSGRFDATHWSCNQLPNANEMSWYVMKGDPRWDDEVLWSTMGHLYRGGMWFKKKTVLQAEGNYNTEVSADGITDIRVTFKAYNGTITSTPPSSTNISKYFFLPPLGYYVLGSFREIGSAGYYWSSSADPGYQTYALYLRIEDDEVKVYSYKRYGGYRTDLLFE